MENRNEPAAGQTAGSDTRAGEELERTRRAAKEQIERAKHAGRERLETGREEAADRAEEIADAVDSAGDELHRRGQQTLASYAGDFAQALSSFADRLRTSSIDDLAVDAQALARRNPRLFVLGSIGVGVLVGRFLKASSARDHAVDLDADAGSLEDYADEDREGGNEDYEYDGGYTSASAASPAEQGSYAAGSAPAGDPAGAATSSDEPAPVLDVPAESVSPSPSSPTQPERERGSGYTDRTTGGL